MSASHALWSRCWLLFGLLLTALGLVFPDASRSPAQYALVGLGEVGGVDAADRVLWILALGSDARPGEPVLTSRSDAIQWSASTQTHRAVTIGIPRDSYVDIPGHGRDEINAAMVYGGPRRPPFER